MLSQAHRHWLYLGLNLLLIVLFVDADPFWYKATDDIHDAAWWADPARLYVTQQIWMVDQFAGALAVGPFSVLWHWMVFSLASCGLWQLKLLSVIPAMGVAFMASRNASDRGALPAFLLFPFWLAYARSGLPEIMQAVALLWFAQSLNHTSASRWFLLGVSLGLATLFKVSFIYLLPAPFIAWWWNDSRIDFRKHLVLASGIVAVLGSAALFWFIPQGKALQPFLNAFSESYFSTWQLIHPEGLIARWVYSGNKPFWADPLVIMSLLWVLHALSRDGKMHPYLMLVLPALLLLSLSDFTSRRFVPLLPLIIIMANSKAHVMVGDKTRKTLELIIALLMYWHYAGLFDVGYRLIRNDGGFFHLSFAGWVVLMVIPLAAGLQYWRSKTTGSPLLAPITAILIGVAGLLRHNPSVGEIPWQAAMVLAFGVLMFASLSLSKGWMYGCGLLLVWSGFNHLQFSERDAVNAFARKIEGSERVAGNSGAFLLALKSKAQVMHFPDKSEGRPAPELLAGVSTSDMDSTALMNTLGELCKSYRLHCESEPPMRLWNGRSQALIFDCRVKP